MMAALHTDQGRLLSIWISVGDIMWLSFSFPNTSSHVFTLSWGMLKTWPGGVGVRCIGERRNRKWRDASTLWPKKKKCVLSVSNEKEVFVTVVKKKCKPQREGKPDCRQPNTYVQGKASSALTYFQDDVIVDRNAVMHGNIQRSQVHVLNSSSAGEFCSQAESPGPQSAGMFRNNEKQTENMFECIVTKIYEDPCKPRPLLRSWERPL